MKKIFFYFFLLFFLFINFSFSESNESKIRYVIGKPYKIKGIWHYPKKNMQYNEVGIASVYSKRIIKKKTKNGELFSNDKISASHKTLPLPSIVRVTNLMNGHAINVRINERGPKNNYRIIKLSQKAAKILEINETGLVEVKIIPQLTIQEQRKLNSSVNFDDNLVKNIDNLNKPSVKSEDLLNKEIEKKSLKDEVVVAEKKNKNENIRLNFKKTKVLPYYLRIEIATFRNFNDAVNLKTKLKSIYDKILISLNIIDNQKYYKLKTIPIKSINEAEKTLYRIHKKGFKNAKLIIEKRKYEYSY